MFITFNSRLLQAMRISEQPCCINYYQLMNNLRRYYLVATDVNDNANDGKKMLYKCMSKYIGLIWADNLPRNDRHVDKFAVYQNIFQRERILVKLSVEFLFSL